MTIKKFYSFWSSNRFVYPCWIWELSRPWFLIYHNKFPLYEWNLSTHRHTMMLISTLTFSTVKYSWFLEGANAGIHQLQTSGQLVLDILLSIRCEGDRRMRVSEENRLRVYACGLDICRLTLTVKADRGLGLAPLWHSDMYLRVWLCRCVSVCAPMCVFTIIFLSIRYVGGCVCPYITGLLV